MLLPSGLQRPNEDEYAMSPLSAPSAGGGYFSSTPAGERPPDAYPLGSLANRPTIPTPLSEIQRTGRGAYPFPRSSSFSDAYSTLPQYSSRYSSPSTESLGHPGMSYTRRPMDYMSRPGMVPGYDPSRPIEGSVSPTDTQESSMPYNMENHGVSIPLSFLKTTKKLTSDRFTSSRLSLTHDNATSQRFWRVGYELAHATLSSTDSIPTLCPCLRFI